MMSESNSSTPEFMGQVVKKPWGYEYLMYQNDLVGIWYLHIRANSKTSLHCHPRKKTSLILLSGEAEVSFLNDAKRLKPVSRMIIRPGLFHSTAAVSEDGIVVLEIETPPDKKNLVRLEDEYGRKGMPYEGPETMIPNAQDCVCLKDPEEEKSTQYSLSGCLLTMERSDDISILKNRPADEMFCVLKGGLFSETGEPILSAGDVVLPDTLDRLAGSFSAPHGISFLSIRKIKD